MIRWPFRFKGEPSDREGKEQAKNQLEVARAINRESVEAAHEHRFLLYSNHFGPSTARALKEGRRT